MTREADIVYEHGDYSIRRVATGYELYHMGVTHAVRIGRYGRQPKYFEMAVERIKALTRES